MKLGLPFSLSIALLINGAHATRVPRLEWRSFDETMENELEARRGLKTGSGETKAPSTTTKAPSTGKSSKAPTTKKPTSSPVADPPTKSPVALPTPDLTTDIPTLSPVVSATSSPTDTPTAILPPPPTSSTEVPTLGNYSDVCIIYDSLILNRTSADDNSVAPILPDGRTYDDLAGEWTKWWLESPFGEDPACSNDTSLLNSIEHERQPESDVHFIAGSCGGNVTREITTFADRLLFFPVSNQVNANFPEDNEDNWYFFLRACFASFMGIQTPNIFALENEELSYMAAVLYNIASKETQLSLELNGCPLDARCGFSTSPFLTLDPFPTGIDNSTAHGAGWFVAMYLPVGQHELRFTAEVDDSNYAGDCLFGPTWGFAMDVSYTVTVLEPEVL